MQLPADPDGPHAGTPLDYEVVVVDDGSADTTPEVLAAISHPRLRVVRQDNGGPAAARNRGVKEANGELIAFTDDDCRPHADWLVQLLGPFADPSVAAVGGRTLPVSTDDVISRFMTHRHYQELPREIDGEIRWVVTCNAALRRSALEQVGGFDESFPVPGGEDTELCSRLRGAGYVLAVAPEAVVLHDHSWRSLRAFYDTWRRYGRGDARAMHLQGRPLDVRSTVLSDVRFCARTVRAGVRDARGGLKPSDAAAFVALDISRMVSQRAGLYQEYRGLRRSRGA